LKSGYEGEEEMHNLQTAGDSTPSIKIEFGANKSQATGKDMGVWPTKNKRRNP